MLFKTTLLAGVVAAASASRDQQVNAKLNALHKLTASSSKTLTEKMRTLSNEQLKLVSAKSALSTRGIQGVSNKATPARALRGKSGKGKGKGSKDDEMAEEVDMYMQMEMGLCAGAEAPDSSVLTEDMILTKMSSGIDSAGCQNHVTTDGDSVSNTYSVTINEDSTFSVALNLYEGHDCLEEKTTLSVDVTEMFNVGGEVTTANTCVTISEGELAGLGYRFSRFESDNYQPLSLPSLTYSEFSGWKECYYNTDASVTWNHYIEDAMGLDFGGYAPFCNEDEDSPGTYLQIGYESCRDGYVTVNYFSDSECTTGVGDGLWPATTCKFGLDDFSDAIEENEDGMLFWKSENCSVPDSFYA